MFLAHIRKACIDINIPAAIDNVFVFPQNFSVYRVYATISIYYFRVYGMISRKLLFSKLRRSIDKGTFAGVLEQLSRNPAKVSPSDIDPSNESNEIRDSTGWRNAPMLEPEIVGIKTASWDFEADDSQRDEAVDEYELTQEVSSTLLEALDAQNIWVDGRDRDSVSLKDENLTPAQRFYLENRELLLRRAVAYSLDQAKSDFEKATSDIEDEWKFYRDPVVRPQRGFLWPVDDPHEPEETTESSSFVAGRFPSIEELVSFLEAENIQQIITVDLEYCGRRDIGEWALIGTAKSAAHARRVGNIARRKINKLDLAHIKCFMNTAVPGQEWVVTRLGPVVIHLMTETDRAKYRLEDIYSVPIQDEFHNDLLGGRPFNESPNVIKIDIE